MQFYSFSVLLSYMMNTSWNRNCVSPVSHTQMSSRGLCLQDFAELSTVALSLLQGSFSSHFKNFSDSFIALSWAFQVTISTDLLCHAPPFLWGHRVLFHAAEFVDGGLIVTKVLLVSHQDNRNVRTEMSYLGEVEMKGELVAWHIDITIPPYLHK